MRCNNSGLNFITLQDLKPVSIISTAVGVSPLGSAKRYDKESKTKKDIPFPNAFKVSTTTNSWVASTYMTSTAVGFYLYLNSKNGLGLF